MLVQKEMTVRKNKQLSVQFLSPPPLRKLRKQMRVAIPYKDLGNSIVHYKSLQQRIFNATSNKNCETKQ